MPTSQRRHHRQRIITARRKLWYAMGYDRSLAGRDAWPPPKDLATRHPFDCGNSRCGLCHYDKFQPGIDRARGNRRWREIELAGWGGGVIKRVL